MRARFPSVVRAVAAFAAARAVALALPVLSTGCAGPAIPEQVASTSSSGGAGGSGSSGGASGGGAAGSSGMTGAGGASAGLGGGAAGGGASGPTTTGCDLSAAGGDCLTCGGATCIDTGSDAQHCGACEHACDAGALCRGGVCAPSIATSGGYDSGVVLGGRLYAWGNNGGGVAWGAPGGPSLVLTPHEVVSLGTGLSAAVVAGVTCALDAMGGVRCFGTNNQGQLGLGSLNGPDPCGASGVAACYATPQSLALTSVVELRLGDSWCAGTHVCARRSDGTVWCWGDEGNCEDGAIAVPTPHPIVGVPASAGLALSAGSGCSRACNGQVHCWGDNGQLQLGRDTGGQASSPAPVPGLRLTSIAGGHRHYCGLREDRTVVCWGASSDGQSGASTDTLPHEVDGVTDVVQLALGSAVSCALRASGEVWCWGNRIVIGTGAAAPPGCSGMTCPTPVQAEVVGGAEIGGGADSMIARLSDGTYRAWGQQNNAQLGNGSTSSKPALTPVLVKGLPTP